MPVEMKKPAKLRYPWPPLDADFAREVSLQDNWASLTAQASRSDPWDIIKFNFDTTDPREVNWYLANWVGCTVVSADGKNLRFGTTQIGKKLVIYIPRPGWYPGSSPDSGAVQAVLSIIHSQQAYKIAFNLDGMAIARSEFEVVFNNIIGKNLGARVVPQLPVTVQYRAFPRDGLPADIFALRAPSFPTLLAQSLLIHEATHALDDIQKRNASRNKREAKAFIAQLLFGTCSGPTRLPIRSTKPRTQWRIALALASRSSQRISRRFTRPFKPRPPISSGPVSQASTASNFTLSELKVDKRNRLFGDAK